MEWWNIGKWVQSNGEGRKIYSLTFLPNIDEFVKSPKVGFSVIPAKAGIQFFPPVISSLDSGFHRSEDFLRDHQYSNVPFFPFPLPFFFLRVLCSEKFAFSLFMVSRRDMNNCGEIPVV